jgi:hypothetical protein
VTVDVDAVGGDAEHTKDAHVCEPPCPTQHTRSLLLLRQLLAGNDWRLLGVSPAALLGNGLALVARGREGIA